MQQIFQILDKIRIRLSRNYLLTILLKGLTVGAITGCLFNLWAIFVPIMWQWKKIIEIVGGISLLFLLYALCHLPNREKSARVGDQCGLEERLITAYENREKDGMLIQMQRQDALERAKQMDWKKALTFSVEKKEWLAFCISFVLLFGTYFLPSVAKEVAHTQEQVQKEIAQELEKIDDIEENLETIVEDKKALELLKQQLIEQRKELKKVKTKEERIKTEERQLWKIKKELKQLEKEKRLQTKEMQRIMQQLEQQFPEQWERIVASDHEQVGEQSKESGYGENGESEKENESDKTGKSSGKTGTDRTNSDPKDGQTGENDEENRKGSNQNGEGVGKGNGQNGQSGAGKGSGKGGSWNTGKKQGEEEKALKEGSMIFVPNGEGTDRDLNGRENTTGNSHIEQGGLAPQYTEGKVPYEQVLEQYTDEAYYKMEERNYPENVQNAIKKYFVELNDGK